MRQATKNRLIAREIDKPSSVEEYESIEGGKDEVLKQMRRLAAKGWRVTSFGWANGFQGGWYALMARVRFASYDLLNRLSRM